MFSGFSSKEMVSVCDKHLKRYHLRPKYVIMKIWQAIRNPCEGQRSLRSAKIFFEKIFKKQI